MSSALQVEHVDFVSLLVQDIPRAKRFYTETLGLELETDSEHDLEVRAGQVTIDLFNPASQGQSFAPSLGGVALRVPDVAAARQELEAKGVEFEGPIVETGVCRMTFFHDPDGNSLILHRRYDA